MATGMVPFHVPVLTHPPRTIFQDKKAIVAEDSHCNCSFALFNNQHWKFMSKRFREYILPTLFRHHEFHATSKKER